MLEKSENCPDPFMLRAYLETIGDCVVVVDDEKIIKVHVHTDNPGKALQKALEFGYFINDPKPKIENMRIQHQNKVKEAQQLEAGFAPAVPEKEFGFVAVAAGHGLEALFTDLGVDVVVRGGQTMNPSTDDILRAILATPAKTVFVLPNNKNIIMAAEQAVKLTDKSVCVLQTRTVPQGISAMMAFDDSVGLAENRINMTKAFEKVSTGLITFAARDSEFEGHTIKEGEILALDNGKLAFTEKDINKATVKLTKKLAKNGASYVTVIYGSDVTEENAEQIQQLLQSKLSDKIEVMLVNGGQPVYYYIISVE
jgi:DAK2 domain fusion protein YloV